MDGRDMKVSVYKKGLGMKYRLSRLGLAAVALTGSMVFAVPQNAEAHGTCRYVRSDEVGSRRTTCAQSLTCSASDGRHTLRHGTEFRVDRVFGGGRYVYGYVPTINRGCTVHNGWFH
jgi:hypothetical protein